MQIIENDLIKEKAYIEVLENGMKFIFIPDEYLFFKNSLVPEQI